MAVKFIIDSASDVLPSEAAALDVTHLPLKVFFGETEYADAVNLTHQEFYEKLMASEVLPTTSQITPAEFADAYESLTANGDSVVVITISSRLSGTYQSAVIAAEDYEDRVFVVDSLSATIGERLLLLRGIAMRDQGMDAQAIARALDEEKKHIRVYARLDTLEYLKKGGRISAATAVVGGLLNIKPIIAVEDGLVSSLGKARGAKQGDALLRGLVEKAGGINTGKPFCLVYSGTTDEQVRKFAAESAELWADADAAIASVGCVIGTHVGPGAVGVAFFEN